MSTRPPAGPAWAGSLMGTSIAATLSLAHGLVWPGRALLVVATALLLTFLLGWLRHRNPGFGQKFMAPWGMVSMGIMALGTAWTTATGNVAPQLLAWLVGMPLGVVTCLWQMRRFTGAPTFLWGLGPVAPMVAATSGGQLASLLPEPWGPPVEAVALGCFLLSLLTGVPVFIRVFAARPRLPAAFAGTAWIPLGIIGQATAAAHLLIDAPLARTFGLTAFAVGIPLLLFAAGHFWGRAVRRWADYVPAWWGSTFPAGTLSLGAAALGWPQLSAAFLGLLLVHWVLCVARFATR
ncbi:TDT family transporter [Corynebacterium nasicanis]